MTPSPLSPRPRLVRGSFSFIASVVPALTLVAACAVEPEPEPTFPPDISFSDSTQGKEDFFGPSIDFERLRQDLAATYPSIEEGSTVPENGKVLCPFQRLLDRAGMYDSGAEGQSGTTASIMDVARAARDFGCSLFSCGAVATAVSVGQTFNGTSSAGRVNLESLHTAAGVAHDCGLTFAKGGTVVDPKVRQRTLDALGARADRHGHLTYSDLKAVKQNICNEQGVTMSFAGRIEIGLIYTFLGGKKRGFIDLDDVVRLFHAELPKTLGKPGRAS